MYIIFLSLVWYCMKCMKIITGRQIIDCIKVYVSSPKYATKHFNNCVVKIIVSP